MYYRMFVWHPLAGNSVVVCLCTVLVTYIRCTLHEKLTEILGEILHMYWRARVFIDSAAFDLEQINPSTVFQPRLLSSSQLWASRVLLMYTNLWELTTNAAPLIFPIHPSWSSLSTPQGHKGCEFMIAQWRTMRVSHPYYLSLVTRLFGARTKES